MSRQESRPQISTVLLAVVLLAAGVLLVWLGYRRTTETSQAGRAAAVATPVDDQRTPGPPPGKGGAPEGGPRGAGAGRAEHPEELKLDPPKGRLLWVASRGESGGDGSEARPFNDLQAALRQLRPGDRLVMRPGRYFGPVRIDESCAEGTGETPIELYARVDAVLEGRNGEPVLTVARRGWKLIGLEIEPGREGGPALVAAGAKDLVVYKGHFHDGWGDGVWIEPGSERVTFDTTHIHIFGPRGGPPEKRSGVVGLRIAPDTRGIAVVASNIHNIAGPPVKVLSPLEYGKPALRVAEAPRIEKTTQLENWPERD